MKLKKCYICDNNIKDNYLRVCIYKKVIKVWKSSMSEKQIKYKTQKLTHQADLCTECWKKIIIQKGEVNG